MNRTLLVIDMINDFLLPGSPLEVSMGRDIIPNILKHMESFKNYSDRIYFVNDSHARNDREFDIWPKHAIENTNGANLCDELIKEYLEQSSSHELEIIKKPTYSAFYKTDLGLKLDVYTPYKLYITGILTNICVFITAIEAQMRGYETYVYRDGVAALSQEANDRALEQLEKTFKIKVV